MSLRHWYLTVEFLGRQNLFWLIKIFCLLSIIKCCALDNKHLKLCYVIWWPEYWFKENQSNLELEWIHCHLPLLSFFPFNSLPHWLPCWIYREERANISALWHSNEKQLISVWEHESRRRPMILCEPEKGSIYHGPLGQKQKTAIRFEDFF